MQDPTQTERALLRVARTLAAAIDIEQITGEITRTALELTGAIGVYVERVISPDGTVDVIATAGRVTPQTGLRIPYPGSLTEELIESGEPLMMETIVSLGRSMAPYLEKTCPDCSGIIVPLLSEGDVVGALVLLRRVTDPAFDARDANTARILGDLASVALRRVARGEVRERLLTFEQEERARAEKDGNRARFLASASVMLSSSLDLPTTMQNLADLAIQAVADWCVIDVMSTDGSVNRIAGAHSDPSKASLLESMRSKYAPEPGSPANPAARTLRQGDPIIMNDVSPQQLREMTRSDEHAAITLELGFHSLMSVPLSLAGEVLGAITLVRTDASANYDDADLAFARDLALRAAVAISNARHFADAEIARGEAEQRKVELEAVIDSKARLIRGFSHDIKNPLGAADGYAQLLLDGMMGELTTKQHESLTRIRAGIASALGLINDVVEFSRAETGQIEVRPAPFNADALVREVVQEHCGAAEQAGARLRVGELAGGVTTCDAIRIRQILGNLVGNAIKYGGDEGEIVVDVKTEGGEHPRILFSVADSGPGIPIEKQHLLFSEFTRLHGGKKEGSGLGLAISRRIARVLGGDVTVDSAEGRGATFTLWIPGQPES